jgi:quinol monooxygenase YgiN
MLIVQVHVRVKPDHVEAFKKATIENARASLREPGIARFDVLQQEDDPTRFVLYEAYRSVEATAAHKQKAHYAKWAEVAMPLLAEERTRVRYSNVFPQDEKW